MWYWHPWQPCIVIRERINPKDGATIVWVPAGKFHMGSDEWANDEFRVAVQQRDLSRFRHVLMARLHGRGLSSNEAPLHTVYLNGYWIYKSEVTVKQYRAFCRATKRKMPQPPAWDWQDTHPIVNVTWRDAADYAVWAGATLPTEAQWEKAMRGLDGRSYPWGNNWDGAKCACDEQAHPKVSPSPVGNFPEDASPYGAQDMAGNVSEWCADWYNGEYYQHSPRRNPTGPGTGTVRIIRGGSWGAYLPVEFRTARRNWFIPSGRSGDVGFRCVCRLP